MVVRLPELKNNLHSQFSVSSDFAIRAIASNFVDVTTSFLLFGSRKYATHLSDILLPLPTGFDPNMADCEQDWTGFNVAAVVVVRWKQF